MYGGCSGAWNILLVLLLLSTSVLSNGEGSGGLRQGTEYASGILDVLHGQDDAAPLCGGRVCGRFEECIRDRNGGYKCVCLKGTGDGLACSQDKCAAGVAQKVDCFQNGAASEEACLERGCCWDPSPPEKSESAVPTCFFPLPTNSYMLKNVVESKHGLTGMLHCSGPSIHGDRVERDGEVPQSGLFGGDVCPLKLVVEYESKHRVRMRITDPKTKRWEVPESLFSPKAKHARGKRGKALDLDYVVTYTTKPFGIAITRATTGQILFNTTQVEGVINGLSFKEQFWELSSTVEEGPLLYGLGQQKAPLKLPAGEDNSLDVYTLLARDPAGTPGHNSKGGSSLYASHPFLMQVSKYDGSAHGLFLRTSNALDVALSQRSVTFRCIGGIIDMTLFMGPTQKDVVSQYTSVIGRPQLPPFWALGFHMCRWGYGTVQATRAVVERMRLEGVPQDSQWNDIDYMQAYRDFTLDSSKFPQAVMSEMVADLHAHGQRYVMIVDAAIAADAAKGSYPALDLGLDMNVFITSENGAAFRGKVWPGYTHFPDFFHPNASKYWYSQLRDWKQVVDFDGVWLDMNEPSNFCDGECPKSKDCGQDSGSKDCAQGETWQEGSRQQWRRGHLAGGRGFDPSHPPYIPGGAASLDVKTVAMTAHQCVQEPPVPHLQRCTPALHYDAHNLYGISEARVTARALGQLSDRRGLIISRSTFPGSGRFGGAWLGDSASTWEDMRLSIPGVLSMGIFGVPLIGADICGFNGNTTREMCIRWSQLGSMYPFSRNHNDIKAIAQEPYAFDVEALAIIKDALLTRYSLTPYMYTLFHEAHVTGVPVARSLLMEFPKLGAALECDAASVEEQFMLGGALLVSPVLRPGVASVLAYLPKSRWYSFSTGSELHGSPGWVEISAPISYLPLHIRGGFIISLQEKMTTTAAVRASAYTLVVAMDDDASAQGSLFLDDGETTTLNKSYKSAIINLHASSRLGGQIGSLSSTVSGEYQPSSDAIINKDLQVRKIVFYGIGPDFSWKGAAYFALGDVMLDVTCVEKDEVSRVVRVSLDVMAGCGNPQSIVNPVQLQWWTNERPESSKSTVSESTVTDA